MNNFKDDVSRMEELAGDEKKRHIVERIVNRLNDSVYMCGIFLYMNQNPNTFSVILCDILNSCDNATRFNIMRYLINKTLNLNLETRKLLVKSIFSLQCFRESFKMFNVNIHNNSKMEQGFGPFSSLFLSNTWTDPMSMMDFADMLTVTKDNDSDYQKSLLTYIMNVSQMNHAYIEGDSEKVHKECSNDDFNTFLLLILLKFSGRICNENKELYERTVGIAFNTHFVSKVRVKKVLQKELEIRMDPNVQTMIKRSLTKLDKLLNGVRLDIFLSMHVDALISSLNSVYECDNICDFLILKYYMYSANKNNIKSVEGILTLINDNMDNIDKTNIEKMLSLLHHTDTIGILSNDVMKNTYNTIIYVMMNEMDNTDDTKLKFTLETSLMTFFKLVSARNLMDLSIYSLYLTMMSHNNDASIVLSMPMFLDISLKMMKKEDSNIDKVCMLNDSLKLLMKYKIENVEDKICDLLNVCELSKKDITYAKLKLHNYDKSLRDVIDSRLSYKEKTKNLVFDFVFSDKRIKEPIFVEKKHFMDTHVKNVTKIDIVIDKTTLKTEKFLAMLKDMDILSHIKNYNNHPNMINKKLDFISLLNVHKERVIDDDGDDGDEVTDDETCAHDKE